MRPRRSNHRRFKQPDGRRLTVLDMLNELGATVGEGRDMGYVWTKAQLARWYRTPDARQTVEYYFASGTGRRKDPGRNRPVPFMLPGVGLKDAWQWRKVPTLDGFEPQVIEGFFTCDPIPAGVVYADGAKPADGRYDWRGLRPDLCEAMFHNQGGVCPVCGGKWNGGWRTFHVDHRVPLKPDPGSGLAEGEDAEHNLQMVCDHCNLKKSNVYTTEQAMDIVEREGHMRDRSRAVWAAARAEAFSERLIAENTHNQEA